MSQDPSTTQYTVAPCARALPLDQTLLAVDRALRSVPGSRVVGVDRQTGIVVIEAPLERIAQIDAALGDRFMCDPNAPLRY